MDKSTKAANLPYQASMVRVSDRLEFCRWHDSQPVPSLAKKKGRKQNFLPFAQNWVELSCPEDR